MLDLASHRADRRHSAMCVHGGPAAADVAFRRPGRGRPAVPTVSRDTGHVRFGGGDAGTAGLHSIVVH